MASQGERVPGGLVVYSNLESMVQDRIPEQDTPEQDIGVQEQFPPQTNPEPDMGAAAAAVYDTSPPLLRNHPPIPAETAHPSTPDMAQLFAMLAEINNKLDDMETNTQTLRGEMQRIGRGLQAGTVRMLAITGELKMATPRAGTNELGGSATAVRPAVVAGEKIIRGTCWASTVRVTEEVTVTVREKLNGVTATCETRHVEMTEIIETREMGTIGKRLHGTDGDKDAHTHTRR